MTIHKLTAGDGYTYLLRQVAGGDVQRARGQDAAEYYTAAGNPPGRWAGRGAELLDVAGQEVTEAQMKALFGMGMHPHADQIIAGYLRDHVTADMGEDELAAAQRADKAASLGAPFPLYQPIEPFARRVAARVAALEAAAGRPATAAETRKIQAQEARRARVAVAGFDVVFAPVKSAALIWALDERPQVQAAVRAAHEAARDAALGMLEEHAALTRTGKGGLAQIGTAGLTMAVFDHYDSRAGEPNLHTHVAVSAKVRGTDGIWRALDARPLYRMTVAVSEFYNTRFETELVTRLRQAGYAASFTAREGPARNAEPVREITGVPGRFIRFFSTRRAQTEARYQQLIRDYRHAHGHDPPPRACHQLARQANLDTRDRKGPARSLNQMRAAWRQSLTAAFGPDAVSGLMAAVPAAPPAAAAPSRPPLDVDAAARQVIAGVQRQRSTWTAWNVRAEAERILRYSGAAATPQEHGRLGAQLTARALSPGHSIAVCAPALVTEPGSLRRERTAESVFTEHGAARYTSAAILAAEQRLVTAATAPARTGITPAAATAALNGFETAGGTRLDPGQRALVTAFASSDRLLAAGLGPAGSGKTTAMRAYADLAVRHGVRIIALAPSAVAADVLSADMGVPADTLHKFLWEHASGPHQERLRAGLPVPGTAAAFALSPCDVVLVDEAGMAGTLDLDQLVAIAAGRGAVVRLLGDYRQLSAPGAGGALRLITGQAGAAELTALYQFADPAEAAATLALRAGDTAALDFYAGADRIRAGSLQAMTDAAYAGWKNDMAAGRTTLMTAAATVNVTALSARARADRVAAGQVESRGVTLHDGNMAGTGDWITTRRNDRQLAIAGRRDWVKNGDAWHVTARHRDGSLAAARLGQAGTVVLPAAYVARDVELLYATTNNRSQGGTVDTAHPLVTPQMSRENLYVAATRARHATTLYVVTYELPGMDPDDQLDRVLSDRRMYAAREILTVILSRETAAKSATQTIRDTLHSAGSLAELAPRFQHALEIAVRPAYKNLLRDRYGDDRAEALTQAPGYAQLRRALLAAEQAGHQPGRLLARAASTAGPPTPDEEFIAQLTVRISEYLKDGPPPGRDPLAPPATPAWLTIPASADAAASDDIPGYLRDLSDVIAARITTLTELAAADPPEWLRALGRPPADPATAARWKGHLAVVTAWRDQHDITTGAPGQILGPRPEPGTADEPAWQHAQASATAARRLSRHRPAATSPGDAQRRDPSNPARGQTQHDARRERALAARQQHRGHRPGGPLPPQPRQDASAPLLQPPPSEPRQEGRQIGW